MKAKLVSQGEDASLERALRAKAFQATLCSSRQFMQKGEDIVDIRLISALCLALETGEKAYLALVEVYLGSGQKSWYQLPLLCTKEGFVLAPYEPAFYRAALQIAAPAIESEGCRLLIKRAPHFSPALTPLRCDPIEGSSNYSCRLSLGQEMVFAKLYAQERPANQEIAKVFTLQGRLAQIKARYFQVPELLLAWQWHLQLGEEQVSLSALLLQRMLQGKSLWHHLAPEGISAFRKVYDQISREEAEQEFAVPPQQLALAAEAGAATAEMHLAFAGEGKGERITGKDLQRLCAEIKVELKAEEQELVKLERLLALEPATWLIAEQERLSAFKQIQQAGIFEELTSRADKIEQALEAIAMGLPPDFDGGCRQVHHEDYHLDQVVMEERERKRSYVGVDFEGEPQRAGGAMDTPLRDVAGMLRSFGYAREYYIWQVVGKEPTTPLEQRRVARLRARGKLWTVKMQEAFVKGYRARMGQNDFLPASPAGFELLLALKVLQKNIYEIKYERMGRGELPWTGCAYRGLALSLARLEEAWAKLQGGG